MVKITLDNITTGFESLQKTNSNYDLIEAAVENTLSRDGTAPNYMQADFDMNSHRILNLPTPLTANEPARLADITSGAVLTALTLINISVDTIAALKAYTMTAALVGQLIYVRGYTSIADGGEGFFRIQSTSPGADDAGLIIWSSTSGYYFVRQFVFAPTPQMFGAKGDLSVDGSTGTNDNTAIQAWMTSVGTGYSATTMTGKGILYLPPGRFKYTSTLTVPANAYVYGVPSKSVLRPSSAVTTAAVIQGAGSTLFGIVIDGYNTSTIIGLSIGASGLTNNGVTEQVQVIRFAGVGGTGLKVVFGVLWSFINCYFGDGTIGAWIVHTANGDPTTLNFITCIFKGNSSHGCIIYTGQEIQFRDCTFEQNGDYGLYVNIASGGGGSAVIWNLLLDACYFESNQGNLASGAARHAAYHAYIRATGAKVRNCFFAHGAPNVSYTNEALAIQFDNAVDFVLDNIDVGAEAGQVSVISSSTGTVSNWIEGCGGIDTVIADSTSFGSVVYNYHKAGTWTPVLTFSTPGNLVVAYAANGQQGRYIRHGKTYILEGFLDVSTFTHTTAAGNLQVTGLPLTPKTVTGFDWTGACGSFQGITKANYTSIAPRIPTASAYIEFDISGSAQTLTQVAFGDVPTGTAKKLKFTITYEV